MWGRGGGFKLFTDSKLARSSVDSRYLKVLVLQWDSMSVLLWTQIQIVLTVFI